jgi:acetaldehyde dehydrogenase / alcohol dehydrogenase
MEYEVFFEVKPDPDLTTIRKGLGLMQRLQARRDHRPGRRLPHGRRQDHVADVREPEAKFEEMAMRFMDIEKRIYAFPELGKKAQFVAIPTTSGTGSEVTPFAVVTDDATGKKYPIADYALTPDMAIVDPELVMNMPKRLTAYGGIDALTHALEAMVSVLSTEFTNSMALEAIRCSSSTCRTATPTARRT